MSLAMTIDERQQYLADLHVGVVSIPRQGKGPLTVPIWYDYSPGGDVWMITDVDSMKGKLLTKCSRISLCVQSEALPYKYVSVEGEFSTRSVAEGELLHMATRYMGAEGGAAYAANSGGGESFVVSFQPENWLTLDYAKLG